MHLDPAADLPSCSAPRGGRRRRLRLLLLLASLALLPPSPSVHAEPPATKKAFVMAADVEPDTYVYQWAKLIYDEAFRRLGIPVQIVTYSLARRSELVEGGAIDGAVARIYAYADTHPDLVRVEEPVMNFTFSIFAAGAGMRARSLEELPPNTLAEYRRGVLMCENALRKNIPPENLSSVTGTVQGIKKLQARRTDVYCDIDIYVREALHSEDFKDATDVRKLFDIATMPTYPYLYRKHADLAPKLAAVLKDMKAEGLLAMYPKRAEREVGWTR